MDGEEERDRDRGHHMMEYTSLRNLDTRQKRLMLTPLA